MTGDPVDSRQRSDVNTHSEKRIYQLCDALWRHRRPYAVPVSDSTSAHRRIEITLGRPRIGWYPRPTVVFNGHGHPAQWGTGTWQIALDGQTSVGVFLFNRVWKFGAAEAIVRADGASRLIYRAPFLPFLPGRIRLEP